MIAFEDQIMSQLKEAMKARDQLRTETLRAMKSALKYKQVENSGAEISEAEALAVFQKLIKQRQDSAEQFDSAGRTEAAEKERQEIEVIQSFLPKALTEQEIKSLIQEAVQKTSASGPKEMGLVMKELKPQITGRADGKLVSELVKSHLESL